MHVPVDRVFSADTRFTGVPKRHPPLHIVLAPDKFKGTMTAAGVVDALAKGVRRVDPDAVITQLPIADGGDGTVDTAVACGMTAVPIVVSGPTGQPVSATIGVSGGTALIELADCCGLKRLPDGVHAPLDANTLGLGQAVAAALDRGCRDIVVGVGGSASTDVGAGLLVALGARLLDRTGCELPPLPHLFSDVVAVDLSRLDPRASEARYRVATDVDSPLLGPLGAVAVYGPQKGVTPDLAGPLEAGIAHLAVLIETAARRTVATRPGMGAAGGVPVALAAVFDTEVMSGAEYILNLLDLPEKLRGADLVVTGEGRFDEQTLSGKGPAAVLEFARSAHVPGVVVAGDVRVTEAQLGQLDVRAYWSLIDRVSDPASALSQVASLLREVGAEVVTWWHANLTDAR